MGEGFAKVDKTLDDQIEELRGKLVEAVAGERSATAGHEVFARLSEAAGWHDPEVEAHTRRVGEYAEILARAAGVGREEVDQLARAAPLHDTGKLAIPRAVVFKPGKLDRRELEAIRRYPELGFEILSGPGTPLLDCAAEIAFSHRERFDGSGYPRGLRGGEIPLSGRIVAVVGVFDVLLRDRPYRLAMPLEQAVRTMLAGRGSQFDAELLDHFIAELDAVLAVASKTLDIDRTMTL